MIASRAMASRPAHALVPLSPPMPREVVWRAIRLRCPRCGATALYASWFRMHDHCTRCGLVYEREQGYFVGAIYVNYAMTIALALGTPLLLDWTVGVPLWVQLVLAVGAAALAPLVFFRWSRAVWLGVDLLVSRALDQGRIPSP